MMEVELTWRETFSAGHRLHNDALSAKENEELYDKCNWPHGHGHNYVLWATYRGPINLMTGMVVHLNDIRRVMRSVCEQIDHKRIDLDVEHFVSQGIPATTENLAVWIFHEIRKDSVVGKLLAEVKLSETENLTVTYRG